MSLVIGLTGGIGSGKSTVANMFKELGVEVVDADLVAREVVMPGQPALTAIAQHFGNNLIAEDGYLKRSLLRDIIFNSAEEKQWLNNLLHPLIRERMLQQISACQSPYCILEAPLLFENGLNQYTAYNLVVDLPETVQMQRAMSRDANSQSQIQAIMDAQLSRQDRVQRGDFIIDNSATNMALLAQQVQSLHNKLLSMV